MRDRTKYRSHVSRIKIDERDGKSAAATIELRDLCQAASRFEDARDNR